MRSDLPLSRDLVLVGGGHAHALVLKRWAMRPLPGARLTLIDPGPVTAYTGMLPGFVAGVYTRSELEIDLVRLARAAGARLVLGRASGLDPEAGLIRMQDRPPVRFDVASLDVGARGRILPVEGYAEHVAPAKPLGAFAERWTTFVAAVEARRARPCVAVIGAGAGGCELALAAARRLSAMGARGAAVTLIEARDAILPDERPAARGAVRRALDRAGVSVRTGARLVRVDAGAALLEDGTRIEADFLIGAAGVEPWPWLSQTGLALHQGWVEVGETLRSVTAPTVFAVGDCAHFRPDPRPKAGVYAVRAATVLFDNLRLALQDQAPRRPFRPQRDYLKLMSAGGETAIAEKHGLVISGPALWRLKDRIDRRFMDRLADLAPMTPVRPTGVRAAGVDALLGDGQPLCGGCGSKAARGPLGEGLADLPPPRRPDVIAGAGGDAALLACGDRVQAISTDHVRAFVEDPWLLARIVAVHALGDIWATGAAPQAALATVILPRMRAGMQAETLRDILAGAASVFGAEGADLVGGHTSVGAEMTLGFTVTGTAGRTLPRRGAQAGDALILTKPLGAGVILAGEMMLAARGREVAACWDWMARPQGAAARILAAEARAMTDVTGFGLAGHLLEMLTDGARAELDLSALPILDGAERLAAQGVRSTLFEANRLDPTALDAPAGVRADLLIDPQTAGGLLAAIPEAAAGRVLAALQAASLPAWSIGQVEPRGPGQPAVRAR